MKIKYIKEGYFNNPDQMKAKAERNKQVSNVEKLAKTSSDMLTYPIRTFFESFMNTIKDRIGLNSFSAQGVWSNDYLSIHYPPLSNTFVSTEDIKSWRYGKLFSNIVVTDIKYNERKIHFDVDLGTVNTAQILLTGGANHNYHLNEIAIPLYIDYIPEFVHIGRNSYLTCKSLPGEVTNELIVKCLQRWQDTIGKELRAKECDDEKVVEFLKEAEYTYTVHWKLDKDIIVFPTFVTNREDFNNSISTGSEGVMYINRYYYPMLPISAKTESEKHKLTWEMFVDGAATSPDLGSEYADRLLESCPNGFEDLAKIIADDFKRYNIKIESGAHIYLSTGYFDKDYLIV